MRSSIVVTTLSFTLKVCVLVQGRYLVEVRLNGYSNPTGKCNSQACFTDSGQTCCDSDDTNNCRGRERCDSYFIYCLRPLGEVDLGCTGNGTRAVSQYNEDDKTDIDFSHSTVLGLSNPQNLSGLGDAYKGIQLFIDVIDADTAQQQPNEFVDSFLINLNLTIAETLQQIHTGIYSTVTMNLTITVFCAENFRGSDCTQCVPGFTGPDCNETDHCFGVNCSGNGECDNKANSFQCICEPGFTGELCQTNIDDCVEVNCSGNGQCVDGVNNFTCDCTPGFSGPQCSEVEGSSGSSVSSGRVDAIAGGVVGALLAVVILLILLMVIVVIVLRYRHYNSLKSREANTQGSGNSGPMPGDNPVYEPGNTVNELKGGSSAHTTAVVTTLPGREGIESSMEERRLDNPIYGGDEADDNVYTTPFDQQDQQSLNNHEFDNPIYGSETYDS